MSTPEQDTRLRALGAALKTERARWSEAPSEEVGRRMIALEEAQFARYLELVGVGLEKAKAGVAVARAAVEAARTGAQEARRALIIGEADADAVLAADDALAEARRALRHATVEEDIARTKLAEAAVARWGVDLIEAAVGFPLSVRSASPELRAALFSDDG
jgi:flavin-binding protein dodecin